MSDSERIVGKHAGCWGLVEYRTTPSKAAGYHHCTECGQGSPMRSIEVIEEWRTLDVGERVRVVRGISETEKELLGREFTLDRFTKPHGYAVVKDEHGSWHVHPESLERVW